jgi:predicted NBD/HSP70 family sugar kinase
MEPDLPADQGAALVGVAVSELLDEVEAERSELLGVGLGLPGPIREPDAEVGDSSILPGWVGVRVTELVSDALRVPVMVDNDANLGALAEWMWGAGRDCQDMVFLKVATGIGAGLIISGQPYRGTGGTAGEIGHTLIDPHGQLCRCGNRGCLETVAGSHALLQAFIGTREHPPTLENVITWALSGDAGCRRLIGDAGRAIGSAMATFCNLLNPARIVVGGELAAAGVHLVRPLQEMLERSAISSAARDVEVVVGELGDRAVALGAVGLVLRSTALDLPDAASSSDAAAL